MDHKTPGDIFQEINDKFEDTEPARLDELEDQVLAAMHKLGSYLMERNKAPQPMKPGSAGILPALLSRMSVPLGFVIS